MVIITIILQLSTRVRARARVRGWSLLLEEWKTVLSPVERQASMPS